VGAWSSEDNWIQERERYHNELRTKTEEKVIEATSDRLADELTRMNEEHIKGFELFRKMSQNFAAILAAEIQETSNSDRSKKVTNKDFTLAVQRYSAIFAQMAQMQRMSLGMKYMDLNVAMDEVIKAGYEVNEPRDD
jgi:hypothetical protein